MCPSPTFRPNINQLICFIHSCLPRAFPPQQTKQELLWKNQRTNLSWQIFVSSVVFGLKISKLSSSVSICSVHNTSHKGFHLQFLGCIWDHLKILEAPSFATKENFCLSSRLISVQLHGGHSFYDKWSINLSQFCLFSWSYPLFGTNFVSGVFEDLSTSAKICQVTTNHPHLWNVSDDRKFV